MASFRIRSDGTFDTTSVKEMLAIPVCSILPPAAQQGLIIYDSSVQKLAFFDGLQWIYVSSGVPPPLIDATTFILHATDNTIRLGFNMLGTANTTTVLTTSQTINRAFITPDIDGTALVSETSTGRVYVNSNVALHGSTSGVQYSNSLSTTNSQYRANQYGNTANVPGVSTFKSRGATIGSLAPVQVGDVIFRDTAVGVTDNLSIPLSGLISINVASVPAGQGYIGTDYELQLVSQDGPANGRRPVFKVDGEGRLHLLESTSSGSHTTLPSGVVTLGVGGVFTVANSKIPANGRVMLTIQPGQAPVGTVWVSNITANTSFTISSTNPIDAGVNIYYQVWVPL